MIDKSFVEQYNSELTSLDCTATVALTDQSGEGVFDLRDDEGVFILISASPEMTAIAYRLYGQGLNHEVRAGEEAAWAKLRHLIGAATKGD